MSRDSRPRSPLAVVLLALVAEAPSHPYRMQQLIKERGKDKIANVAQPNSVYQTIEGLRRAGLIAVREMERDQRRPERTVYEITSEGSQTLRRWLHIMLSMPKRDFPDFPAALSLLALLEPKDVLRLLEGRTAALVERLADTGTSGLEVPRLFLIEEEYQLAMIQAELDWIRSIMEDLRAGRLSWSEEWLHSLSEPTAGQSGPDVLPA